MKNAFSLSCSKSPRIHIFYLCTNLLGIFFFRRICLSLFVWFLNVLVNYQVISRTGPKTEHLTILRAATHETELGDHDLAGHIILTQPVGSGRPQWQSNLGPPHQKSRTLPTELPHPPWLDLFLISSPEPWPPTHNPQTICSPKWQNQLQTDMPSEVLHGWPLTQKAADNTSRGTSWGILCSPGIHTDMGSSRLPRETCNRTWSPHLCLYPS